MAFHMTTLRPATRMAVKPTGLNKAHLRPCPMVLARATGPLKSLDSQVKEALQTAEQECNEKGTKSKDCEVAWDQAEELLAAKSHKKQRDEDESDPLEKYCKDAPDADECRVHEL